MFHASIGRVYTPTDRPVVREPYDTLKGERYFPTVRTDDLSIEYRWDMGRELEEVGYPGMASAVRPMTLAPDERYEGKPAVGAVRRVVELPKRTTEPRERYVLDSAHHGTTMNASRTTLCAAGTMDGYAAVVDRESEAYSLVEVGDKPYWPTNGPHGETCWVSVSGEDAVVVIDYATAQTLATIPVGDHPQRVREGVVARDILPRWR